MKSSGPLLFVIAWFAVGGFVDLLFGQRAVLFMTWAILGMALFAHWDRDDG